MPRQAPGAAGPSAARGGRLPACVARQRQDPTRRSAVGDRLVSHKWPELAAREYEAVLAQPGAAPLEVAPAHLGLANVAGQRHDHFTRAEHLRKGLELAERFRFIVSAERASLTGDPRKDLRLRMHWAYLRAARQQHDDAAAKEHVAEMLKLQPTSESITLEVVPLLKKWGDTEQAKALFNRSYQRARAAVAASPNDPQPLNALAWMCALCGEELDEAERASKRAVELAPDNVALLDTAAEVQFRLGHGDEAVRLETKALQLKPDDPVIKRQLERFEGKRPPTICRRSRMRSDEELRISEFGLRIVKYDDADRGKSAIGNRAIGNRNVSTERPRDDPTRLSHHGLPAPRPPRPLLAPPRRHPRPPARLERQLAHHPRPLHPRRPDPGSLPRGLLPPRLDRPQVGTDGHRPQDPPGLSRRRRPAPRPREHPAGRRRRSP